MIKSRNIRSASVEDIPTSSSESPRRWVILPEGKATSARPSTISTTISRSGISQVLSGKSPCARWRATISWWSSSCESETLRKRISSIWERWISLPPSHARMWMPRRWNICLLSWRGFWMSLTASSCRWLIPLSWSFASRKTIMIRDG